MTIYSYFPKADHAAAEKKQYVKTYLDAQQLHADATIEEQSDLKIHWEKRDIGHFLMDTAKQGDVLITYDTLDIARSTCQMLELLMAATNKGISIHFVKYDMAFQGKPTNQLHDLLALMQQVESDYIQRRTTDALARRKAAGLPLGRPKGRKNKNLKLDKHRKEIARYLELNVSKASIARLVDCHPQTLYDWIDRQKESGKLNVGKVGHNMDVPQTELSKANTLI